MKNTIMIFGLLAAFSPFNLFAQGAPVPHIFGSGNPIISSEFNANFQELSDRNDATQTQVNQNASDISSTQSSVSTIQGTLTQIQTDITNLQATGGTPLLQFVGNSSGTTTGGVGIRGLTEFCQADFADSRVCTSEEYSKTITFPAAIPSTTFAWILPANMIGSGNPDTNSVPLTELYSGVSTSDAGGGLSFNCSGWRFATGTGLSVTGIGSFLLRSCVNVQPVSCCK